MNAAVRIPLANPDFVILLFTDEASRGFVGELSELPDVVARDSVFPIVSNL